MERTISAAPLTSCQTKALDVLQRQGNAFLTGAAGTGKSFLLDRYLSGTSSADFPVVASTGAAAVIVGGRTFHSFFGLGILEGGAQAAVAAAVKNRRVTSRLQRACCVIIDEISMLSGVTLKAAEAVARISRGRREPWGGLRIIAVGDFAQLPPVTPDQQAKDWAFLHPVWQETDFTPALLSTVMRTQDVSFLEILNFIRDGVVNDRVRAYLDERMTTPSDSGEGTRLYPHRAQAEQFNIRRLESLPGKLHSFQTHYEGNERYRESARRSIPIPDLLHLKEGALIMMRKNDPSGGMLYVNGSLGHIRRITGEVLTIDLLSGRRIEIAKDKFSYLDGDGHEVMSAWNFPVTLAWATTIHKAQGASLDRMIVDLHQLWEPGQAYVALSRVRSGAGLKIERWSSGSIRAEPLVTAFYDSLAEQSRKYVPKPFFTPPAPTEEPAVIAHRRKQMSRKDRAKQIAKLITQRLSIETMAEQCGIKSQRVIHYLEHLVREGMNPDLGYLADAISDRPIIDAAFAAHGFDTLSPAFQALEGRVPFDTLRLARCVHFAGVMGGQKSAKEDVVRF